MKKIFSIFVLFCLFSGIFAAVSCNTTYTDELTVRALDASNRPLTNVSITLTYQLSDSTGKGYATTVPKLTGIDGTAKIKIQNLETQEDKIKCDITIIANYDGVQVKKIVYANSHESIIDLSFPAHNLIVTVRDQDNKKVSGATVVIGEFTKLTDENGVVGFSVCEGEKYVFASYEGAKKDAVFPVFSDTSYSLSFYVSDLILHIVDDEGNPIDASATFFGETYNSSLGKIIIPEVGISNPQITVTYNGIKKSPQINLDLSNEYTIIFDKTPPQLLSIIDEKDEKYTNLLITLKDPGSNPSGINESTLSVIYDYGKGWKNAKIFPKGSGLYIAQMDPINFDTIVFFSIYVEDKDGNTITIPGQYEIFTTTSIPEEKPQQEEGNNWISDLFFTLILPLIIIIAILAGAFFLYLRFIKKE